MADALFLVQRTVQGVNDDRNRVREVVIFNDNGDADSLVIQNTIDALNAQTPVGDGLTAGEPVYPDGYFDTVTEIATATPAGPFGTEFDYIAFAPRVDAFTA